MKKPSPSTPELHEAQVVVQPSGLDLEFPVDPEFDPDPPRLSPSAFVAWCEEMMDLIPVKRQKPERKTEAHAEFVL